MRNYLLLLLNYILISFNKAIQLDPKHAKAWLIKEFY